MNDKKLTPEEIEKALASAKSMTIPYIPKTIRVDFDPLTGLDMLVATSDMPNNPMNLAVFLRPHQLRELRRQLDIYVDAVEKGSGWHKRQSTLQ